MRFDQSYNLQPPFDHDKGFKIHSFEIQRARHILILSQIKRAYNKPEVSLLFFSTFGIFHRLV